MKQTKNQIKNLHQKYKMKNFFHLKNPKNKKAQNNYNIFQLQLKKILLHSSYIIWLKNRTLTKANLLTLNLIICKLKISIPWCLILSIWVHILLIQIHHLLPLNKVLILTYLEFLEANNKICLNLKVCFKKEKLMMTILLPSFRNNKTVNQVSPPWTAILQFINNLF